MNIIIQYKICSSETGILRILRIKAQKGMWLKNFMNYFMQFCILYNYKYNIIVHSFLCTNSTIDDM